MPAQYEITFIRHFLRSNNTAVVRIHPLHVGCKSEKKKMNRINFDILKLPFLPWTSCKRDKCKRWSTNGILGCKSLGIENQRIFPDIWIAMDSINMTISPSSCKNELMHTIINLVICCNFSSPAVPSSRTSALTQKLQVMHKAYYFLQHISHIK